MKVANILSEAPVKSLFFKYYIPALTSVLSITLHQVINGIILGQQVGKEGLGAVGLYGPIVIVFISVALPIMIGGGILIGKNLGSQDFETPQKIFQFATTFGLFLGSVIAISTPFTVKPLSEFLAGPENIVLVENTSDYILWQLIALPFFFLGVFWGNFISHDGAPKISRNASLIAVSFNIILDLIFIVGLDLGVKGASIATAISIFSSAAYLFIYIAKGRSHFSIQKFRFIFSIQEWKELLNLGLPSFVSEISFSVGLLVINQYIVSYGPITVSAFGIVNYLSFIFLRLFTAAMIASLRIISYNIGAKLPNRVLEVFKFSLVFSFVLGLLVTALGYLSPGFLVLIFSGDKTEEFRNVAIHATSLYFILFIAAGPNYILSAYLQSIGKPIASSVLNILKGFVLVTIFLLTLPGFLNMGLNGIWLSRSLSEILTLLLVGIYTLYYNKKYYSKKAIIAKP